MTLPNLITSLRIILTPVFVISVLNDDFLMALGVFFLAAVSDGADGFIARVFNQKSRLGAFLDPLADKILLVAAFIVLAVREFVPSWLTVVVISRDVLILLGVLILYLNGTDFAIRPTVLSKATTCLQLVALLMVLCTRQWHFWEGVHPYVFWATGLLTISSGLHYMHYWFRVMSDGGGSDKREGRLDKT